MSSPTWQLPVLEGVLHLRTLSPGVTLTIGHHVAEKRERQGVRRGWNLSRLQPLPLAMICVVSKRRARRAPRAGGKIAPALSTSYRAIPASASPQRHVQASCHIISVTQVEWCSLMSAHRIIAPSDSGRAIICLSELRFREITSFPQGHPARKGQPCGQNPRSRSFHQDLICPRAEMLLPECLNSHPARTINPGDERHQPNRKLVLLPKGPSEGQDGLRGLTVWRSPAADARCPPAHTSSSQWTGGTALVYRAPQVHTRESQCPRGGSAGPLPGHSAAPGHTSELSLQEKTQPVVTSHSYAFPARTRPGPQELMMADW